VAKSALREPAGPRVTAYRQVGKKQITPPDKKTGIVGGECRLVRLWARQREEKAEEDRI